MLLSERSVPMMMPWLLSQLPTNLTLQCMWCGGVCWQHS